MPANSIRDQIIAAAIMALNTGTPSGVPRADRARTEPYQPVDLPAITVFPHTDETTTLKNDRWGPIVDRLCIVRVACYVAGDPPDALLDPMIVWAEKTLNSNPFGNLASDILPGRFEWQYANEDQKYSLVLADFHVWYQTLRTDPTATTP
jgi:hypothetical protein